MAVERSLVLIVTVCCFPGEGSLTPSPLDIVPFERVMRSGLFSEAMESIVLESSFILQMLGVVLAESLFNCFGLVVLEVA